MRPIIWINDRLVYSRVYASLDTDGFNSEICQSCQLFREEIIHVACFNLRALNISTWYSNNVSMCTRVIFMLNFKGLNIKTAFPRYGDSHVKDKTFARPSYLWLWIPMLVRRHLYIETATRQAYTTVSCDQAPVPLTIFRSNSKLDENLKCSSLKCTLLITTKVCTRHDSYTVVACAKFRCDG